MPPYSKLPSCLEHDDTCRRVRRWAPPYSALHSNGSSADSPDCHLICTYPVPAKRVGWLILVGKPTSGGEGWAQQSGSQSQDDRWVITKR